MTWRLLDSKEKTPILTWAADGMRARPRGTVATWSHSMRPQPLGSSPVGIPNCPSLWAGDHGSQGPRETSWQNKLRKRTWVNMESREGMKNMFRMKTSSSFTHPPLLRWLWVPVPHSRTRSSKWRGLEPTITLHLRGSEWEPDSQQRAWTWSQPAEDESQLCQAQLCDLGK